MTVPLLDVTRAEEPLHGELRDAFERVMQSGHYILGPEVAALERECADYIGAEHAIGVSSGSDALIVALMALDIGPGDEVICPTFTFFATAGAVHRLGARAVFVDCDPETYNLRASDIEPALTERTKAVIPVHLFGQCCEMPEILALCEARGIPVIEDAAQAIGARCDKAGAGSVGAIGCFSFYPTKNLGALGDAGLVTTNDAALAHRMRLLRGHGMEPKYYHSFVGGNFRIDALQAAMLRVKLPHLDTAHAARRHNADHYARLFENAGLCGNGSNDRVRLPIERVDGHIYNQYVVAFPGGTRDALRAHLGEQGIGTEIYYPVPLHMQECFRAYGHAEGDFPVSEAAARDTLALPIFPALRPDQIEYVVDTIAAFFG